MFGRPMKRGDLLRGFAADSLAVLDPGRMKRGVFLRGVAAFATLAVLIMSDGAAAQPAPEERPEESRPELSKRPEGVTVGNLRVEGMENPMGVEVQAPRMSWQCHAEGRGVRQTAYHIRVSSTAERADGGEGDLWDSGKVLSDNSLAVPYGGAAIPQNTRVWWRVKIYTNTGESEWSEARTWTTGLRSFKAWNAQWIGKDSPAERDTTAHRLSARYLRTEFETREGIERATAYISGLGWYELYMNGQRIGDQVLAPSPTDYRQSQHYNAFDVTEALRTGRNAVGVVLGNGRYFALRQEKPYKNNTFGYPKLLFTLIIEYADGRRQQVSSNARNWLLTDDGPIGANNEYDGEEYDARKEMAGWTEAGFDPKGWRAAERVAIPAGVLRSQTHPLQKVMKRIRPRSIQRKGDRWILDMGQNMAGWIAMRVRGERGTEVRLRFAETLQADGELATANLRNARATDTYILKGDPAGECWRPAFTFHGFRYVEVSGYPGEPAAEDFTGEVVYDDLRTVGTFRSSDTTLNRVVENAWWGIVGNYKGMPVDCPQRNERQPWLGDHVESAVSESFLVENRLLYAKWTRDICEAQRFDGSIPDVAPAFWNYYSDNMTWPAALPAACEMLYERFGDKEPMERSYPHIKRWLDYMWNEYRLDDGTFRKDSYGDWCMPPERPEVIHSKDPERITDAGIIASATYCHILQQAARFAELCGHGDDIAEWQRRHKLTREALNARHLTAEGYYGNNTVTANILPLAYGLVPEERIGEVRRHVIERLAKEDFHTACGVVGIQWLQRELCRMGRADVAWAIATQTSYPSWGYMVSKGATTIWELWNGDTADTAMNSGNHMMLVGDLLTWCFENLAGIRPAAPACKELQMAPTFEVDGLEWIEASYESPYGAIRSAWRRQGTWIEWEVTLPANTSARLRLPVADASEITESGVKIAKAKEAAIERIDGQGTEIRIGSGGYSLRFPRREPQKAGVLEDRLIYAEAPYPQCHAATIEQMTDGRMIAAWFGGSYEGADDVCIYTSVRERDGRWSEPLRAADGILNDTLRKACYNPVLYQLKGGDLALYFKIGKRVADWRGYYVTSADGGRTWSERRELQEGFLGPVKNRPVRIGNRIIAPSSTEVGGWKLHFELSDDEGKTWRMVGPLPAEEGWMTSDLQPDGTPAEGKRLRPLSVIQPSVLVLKDGTLRAYARTRNGLAAVTESRDRGETWSTVQLTEIPNNNSGLDAVNLKDGRFIMIYNKVRTAPGLPKGARTPLCVALSDDGRTWYDSITLEDSPIGQYSYPTVMCDRDGMVHIVYTWRRLRVKYVMLDPAKLPVGERIHFE